MTRLVLLCLLALTLLVGCVAEEPVVLSGEGIVEIPIPEVTIVILPEPRIP